MTGKRTVIRTYENIVRKQCLVPTTYYESTYEYISNKMPGDAGWFDLHGPNLK